jgi:hypothetical protein
MDEFCKPLVKAHDASPALPMAEGNHCCRAEDFFNHTATYPEKLKFSGGALNSSTSSSP